MATWDLTLPQCSPSPAVSRGPLWFGCKGEQGPIILKSRMKATPVDSFLILEVCTNRTLFRIVFGDVLLLSFSPTLYFLYSNTKGMDFLKAPTKTARATPWSHKIGLLNLLTKGEPQVHSFRSDLKEGS